MVGDVVAADQFDKILSGVARQRGGGKARVVRQVTVGSGVHIGEVAAAAAGDADLFADAVIAFQDSHRAAALSRRKRAHQAGRAAAEHYDISGNGCGHNAPNIPHAKAYRRIVFL